jgi:hypothetical protein
MVMHLLKIIPPKMHDENDGQLPVVDGVALRHCLLAERAPETWQFVSRGHSAA